MNAKKKILFSLFSICICTAVSAQKNEKHQVRIGYSDATFLTLENLFSNGLSDVLTEAITGVRLKDPKITSSGMIEAGYRYSLSETIKIGADINYFSMSRVYDQKGINAKTKSTYLAIMPNAEINYANLNHFRIYGSLSAGYANVKTKGTKDFKYSGTDNLFAYQINPIAVDWNLTNNFGIFAELGVGYKGIGQIGLNYSF